MGKIIKGKFIKDPSEQYDKHPLGFGPLVKPNKIPKWLKENALWCVWQAVIKHKNDGTIKVDKIPCNTNGRVSTQKPKLWMTFEDAYGLYEESRKNEGDFVYNGVGILVKDLVCVDIDHDLEQGDFEDVNTYKEYSPSGEGLRIIGHGWTDYDLTNPVEIYSGNAPRFVTITGDAINSYGMIDIGDVANDVILANKNSILVTEDTKAEPLPEIIEFDNQAWWPTGILKFSGGAEDRSAVLFGWCKTLISEGLTNQQVLSVFAANPDIMSMASDHWKGGDHKAKAYLWRDINKARAECKAEFDNDVGEFGKIEGLVDFDSVEKGEAEITGDIEIDKLLVARENQEDRYKQVEKQVLQSWRRDVTLELPSLSKLKFHYRNVVYNGKNGKFYVLDRFGFVRLFTAVDYLGCAVDMKKILGKIEGDEADVKEFIKVAKHNFMMGVKANRQISSLVKRVDMFIKKPLFHRLNTAVVEVVVPHTPFPVEKMVTKNDIIVREYLKHFGHLHEFLDFLVNSRFASNRRKCSLWFQADSNWGKGFLTSIFEDLGIVTTITEDELEKAFSGSPLGKSMAVIYKSWILHIDEFKKVKAELKMLDNSLVGSSKNELETKVEVYLKLFTSAEDVSSLTGEQGVENQFANRFSYFSDLTGNIEDLACWEEYGQHKVYKTIKAYISAQLNLRVEKLVAMGRLRATEKADAAVLAFHNKYRITQFFESLEDTLPATADAFVMLVNNVLAHGIDPEVFGPEKTLQHDIKKNAFKIKKKGGDGVEIFVKAPKKLMADFLYLHGGKSEGVKLSHKTEQVIKLCCSRTYKKIAQAVQRIHGTTTKTVRAKGITIDYLEDEESLEDFEEFDEFDEFD